MLINECSWYKPMRLSRIVRDLQACYSVDEDKQGTFKFYQATELEPIADIPPFIAPGNKYRESAAAAAPVPSPAEVAPAWWRPSQEYVTPPNLMGNAGAESSFTGMEKKVGILATLAANGKMKANELALQVPELQDCTVGEAERILGDLARNGFVSVDSEYDLKTRNLIKYYSSSI